MADPITQEMFDWRRHIVTAWITHTSAGATEEAINLPADYPKFDMNKAHPVISGIYIDIEGDDSSGSIALLPENECKRAETVFTANGQWAITDLDTIRIRLTTDLNGVLGVTYWAAGAKNL